MTFDRMLRVGLFIVSLMLAAMGSVVVFDMVSANDSVEVEVSE